MDDFLHRKLKACKDRLADLDRVYVAAHNALQLPCFRRKKGKLDLPDRWYWYHSNSARRGAVCTLESTLRVIDWHLSRARTQEIEDVFTRAQQEIRQLAKLWDRYMNMVNRLARIHNHRTFSIPFPDDDLTLRYYPRYQYVSSEPEPTKRSLRQGLPVEEY